MVLSHFKVGTVMTKSERKIFIMTARNGITSSHFAIHEQFFNENFKNNLVSLISFLIPFNLIPYCSFAIE